MSSGVKRLRHPELGEIALQNVVLQWADDPELKIVTFAPEPPDRDRIVALLRRQGHPSVRPVERQRP